MPSLSIIIPCHNEEKRLDAGKILGFMHNKPNVHLYIVNDGSTDGTIGILQHIKASIPDRVDIINNKERLGKAEAIRIGLSSSASSNKSEFHSYLDADLAVSLDELYRLYELLTTSRYSFIFGSRIKKIGSEITRNEWRHFYSRIIATMVGFITKLDVYDTQCSAKIFRKELLNAITNEKYKTKWLFDVELICRINKIHGDLNQLGYEEPLLQWTEKKGSKLRWFNFFSIMREVFVIYKYYRAK